MTNVLHDETVGWLYVVLACVAALINVPVLLIHTSNAILRSKYPTIVGTLCVDFICIACLLTSGVLYLVGAASCLAPLVSSVLPILQTIYIFFMTIDFMVARFRPVFFHSPPPSYRIAFFCGVGILSICVLLISFGEDGIYPTQHHGKDCPTHSGHLFIYSTCIIFNLASLICQFLLFRSLSDLQFKLAITIRFALVLSLIFVPFMALIILDIIRDYSYMTYGVVISNALISIQIAANALLQLRNKDVAERVKTVLNNVTPRSR
uniref:G_PROTEIN_RECEP_F1_2 domain-containing protein n=1 Tax=Panagrellus redivivus TaxID=6233 RepID=A0A7E4ZU82_PANRE